MSGNVKLFLNPVSQILREKGLSVSGDVQRFHTQNVMRRIVKYMPYRTGGTIKLTIAQTNIHKPEIVTDAPCGKFLFYGKVMVGIHSGSAWAHKGEPKKVTSRDLKYTKTKNPQAGPRWDRALSAAEGAAMAADLQRYIKWKG